MKRVLIVTLISLTTFGTLLSQGTKSGSLFYEQVRLLPFEDREKLILTEILAGNIPSFIKKYIKIKTIQKDKNGKKRCVTIFVSPDYLSIGSNEDYFIIPMGPITAQSVANQMGASLPTPKIVDIIYMSSKLKLEPFNYIPRGDRNETPDIFYDHSRVILAQIKAAGRQPGIFVAGTKKDIVISSKLADLKRTKHVTIYGWHRLDGKPIQPVTNVHINTYLDYSHGVRLISNKILIDSKEYNYEDILKDPLLFKLISDEAEPLSVTSYLP